LEDGGGCKLNKNLQFLSVIFLGICLLLSAWFLSQSLETKTKTSEVTAKTMPSNFQVSDRSGRFEFITIANDYFIIFDSQTSQYWSKIGSDGWKKEESILTLTTK
jgi:hypothetical protein